MGPNPSLKELAAVAAVTASEPPRARVVRILVHDADATDSSSSEDEAPPRQLRRVRGGSSSARVVKCRVMEAPRARPAMRFRGVRQRPWGRWGRRSATRTTAAVCGLAPSTPLRRPLRPMTRPTSASVVPGPPPTSPSSCSPPPEPAKPIDLLTPPPGKLITLPPVSVTVEPTVPLQVKKEVGSCDEVEVGGTSQVQALVHQPMPLWEMIAGKRKKRSACGSGTRVQAIHAASVCVDEVGGA